MVATLGARDQKGVAMRCGVTSRNSEELRLFLRKVLLASVVLLSALGPVSAETIQGALAKAYKFNATMNSARAAVRATDENVPIASPATGRKSARRAG
jgi:outer membrane protein